MLTIQELEAAKKSYQKHKKTYYQLLGLEANVDGNALKKAYRMMALKYHPDKAGKEGEEFFKDINEAHEILRDPQKRKDYDYELKTITSTYSNVNNNNNNNVYSYSFDDKHSRYLNLINQLVKAPLTLTELVILLKTLVKMDIELDRPAFSQAISEYLKKTKNLDLATIKTIRSNENYQIVFDYLTGVKSLDSTQLLLLLDDLIRKDFTLFNSKLYRHLSKDLYTLDMDMQAEALIAYAQIQVLEEAFLLSFETLQKAKGMMSSGLTTTFEEAQAFCLKKTQVALYMACEAANFEKVMLLLTIKELTPSLSLIIAATKSKSLKMVEFVCDLLKNNIGYADEYQWNAAHYAAWNDSLDIIKYFHAHFPDLLKEFTGIGLRAGDETIVIVAARYKATAVLQFLCKEGYELNHVDVGGWTALNRCYSNSQLGLFNYLLAQGADPNSYYNPKTKYTLMHQACYDNEIDYIKALLATNKVEFTKDNKGQFPLDISSYKAKDGIFLWGSSVAKAIVQLIKDYENNAKNEVNNSQKHL